MLDIDQTFTATPDGLLVANEQTISQAFIDDLADYRKATASMKTREYQRVASIPVIFIHKWLKEGFNLYRESAESIAKRLRQENLHAFLTTEKSI